MYAVFFGCWQIFFSAAFLPSILFVCVPMVAGGAALSDYRVEQPYRLSYHNKLSQSARPTGRTLHQRTKEKIKECYNSITIWSQSLTGDKTRRDTCNASNYSIHRWMQGGEKEQHNSLRQESQKSHRKVLHCSVSDRTVSLVQNKLYKTWKKNCRVHSYISTNRHRWMQIPLLCLSLYVALSDTRTHKHTNTMKASHRNYCLQSQGQQSSL